MFDIKDAQIIARQEMETIINEDPTLTKTEVDELCLEKENNLAWVFAAAIPKLIKEGWVPGAITIFIDKKDGHIWSDYEQKEFHRNQENMRLRAGFIKQKMFVE